MPQSALTCSIILPGIIKVFLTVAELCYVNKLLMPAPPTAQLPAQRFPLENLVNALTCSTILPSIIKIYLMVPELLSGNENEVKSWVRGHN